MQSVHRRAVARDDQLPDAEKGCVDHAPTIVASGDIVPGCRWNDETDPPALRKRPTAKSPESHEIAAGAIADRPEIRANVAPGDRAYIEAPQLFRWRRLRSAGERGKHREGRRKAHCGAA